MSSAIWDKTCVLKEILKLVAEGYDVSFRPDYGDAFQIRLCKDGFTSCRVCTYEEIRYTTAMDAEEYLMHTLRRLLVEHEYYRRKHNEGNSV